MQLSILLVALVFAFQNVSANGSGSLDYSALPIDSSVQNLVERFMPPDVEKAIMKRHPSRSGLIHFLALIPYLSKTDSGQDLRLLYTSDGIGVASLQLIQRSASGWQAVDESREVTIGGDLTMRLRDINCDSTNEVLLSSTTGAAGFRSLDVVVINNNSLEIISPVEIGKRLIGRFVELTDRNSDCVMEIEVFDDGPVKYQPDRKRIYRFDRVSKSYKFHSEEKLESQKTDE